MNNLDISQLFSLDYHTARNKFLDAARGLTDIIQSFQHDQFPDLFCDVAIIEELNKPVLVTISGTHGIEGYCGSAIQTNLLIQQRINSCLDLFQIHIHILNPWGMKWFSRCNEDNIDINRNFINFSYPLPINHIYEAIQEQIEFKIWNQQQLKQFWLSHQEFVAHNGLKAWNIAFSSGQYAYPNGIMYGGLSPSWSNKILQKILGIIPNNPSKIAVLDFHSGVGKFAKELIFVNSFCSTFNINKLRKNKTNLILKNNKLPINTDDFQGIVVNQLKQLFSEKCISLVVEYGTYPGQKMTETIIYDRWNRYNNEQNDSYYQKFMLEMYCPKNPLWQSQVIASSFGKHCFLLRKF